MRILVVYDDHSDPLVSLLATQQNILGQEVLLLSLKEFIEKIQVRDKLDINGASIQWRIRDDSDLTWTNHNTYLVNRCHNIRETCDSLFHPDDREYAQHELTAYLKFVFTSFKYHIQPVSYYGISGSVMPLFMQWDKLKGISGLSVPSYYVGPYYLLKWEKVVVNHDPYDVTHWVVEDVHNDTRDYVFAYKRPIGQPVFVYITPIGANIVESDYLNKVDIDEALLKSLGMNIGKKLGISLGEILFFVSEQKIIFGAATPRIISSKNTPDFPALTINALTTASAYDSPNDLVFVNYANQRREGGVIAIGSTNDRTMKCLCASNSFGNNGVFLPLEELTVSWNFTYANGNLKFFREDTAIEPIGAIYYRPFVQQGNAKNYPLGLLHSCLDSYDGLVYGRGASQYLNSSKPLQLANLIPVISNYSSIELPHTTIIKGSNIEGIHSPPKGTKYITKSISGIRSKVVNNETFSVWNRDGLTALPTLFQKQIDGEDVRVHVCHNKVFAVKISNKNAVDYRYSGTFSLKEIFLPEEIAEFCLTISRVEQNPLIGIDFIQTTHGYVFLESNPMPGWEWFCRNNNAVREDICSNIMEVA